MLRYHDGKNETIKYFARNYDVTDYPPNNCHVTNLDIISLTISIVSHLVDVGFDVHIAYVYYSDNEFTYFGLTTLFILFPAFINTVVSTRMYVMDENNFSLTKMASRKWIMRIIILLLQLAPVLRYVESLKFALKSRKAERSKDIAKQREYYILMLKEDSDVALLRVFECFLEAAPQQILQISILLKSYTIFTSFKLYSQVGSIGSSLVSMAWCMASYHRVIRFAQEDKDNISWTGTVTQFLWHFLVTVSRILAISVAASLYHQWTTLGCIAHWMIMTLWLSVLDRTFFCETSHNSSANKRFGEILFASVLGLVYLFTYISPGEGRTRYRYIIYYSLCFVENVIAVTLWAVSNDITVPYGKWYFYALLIGCIVPFILGIFFMIIYYNYFHPNTGQNPKDIALADVHITSIAEEGNCVNLANVDSNIAPEMIENETSNLRKETCSRNGEERSVIEK